MIDKKSWQTDEYKLRKLKEFFKDIELWEITPSIIRKFRASKLKEEITKTTINREIALLKKMFNMAIEESCLKHNPAKKIKMYSELDSVRDRVLDKEEEPRLFAELAEYVKPMSALTPHLNKRTAIIFFSFHKKMCHI